MANYTLKIFFKTTSLAYPAVTQMRFAKVKRCSYFLGGGRTLS